MIANNHEHTSPWPLFEDRMEEKFIDAKPVLNDRQAIAESARCLNCYLAPCINACPTGINIPQFINRISTADTYGAAQTILDANILGLSCAMACPTEVLCEGACVYHGLKEPPIMIGRLQRFAVQKAYDAGKQFYAAGLSSGKKVALVGAGPASLACAFELRRLGHEAIIYEKDDIPGGLNTYGIAPYKMKAQVSLREIKEIEKIGVVFRFGYELGKNLRLEQLLQKYNSVFLGIGLGEDSKLKISNLQHPRVRGAVKLIAELKMGKEAGLAWINGVQSALIVGGGNTALDVARELKALGVPEVFVSYRRDRGSMSAYAHEYKLACEEGVQFLFNTVATSFSARTSEQVLVGLQNTIASDEKKGLQVNLVVMAIGQGSLASLFDEISDLQFEEGHLIADPVTGRTGHQRIFAGGDLVNGGKEVVNAVAEGKRAALAIHKELSHG